jgi:hypothetical protein
MDTLSTNEKDMETLRERNLSLLYAIQFAIFAEEIFQTVMKEALSPDANWTESAHSVGNYMTNGNGKGIDEGTSKRLLQKKKKNKDFAGENGHNMDNGNSIVSVIQVLDDEIELRIDDKHTFVMKLVDFEACKENVVVDDEKDENDDEKVENDDEEEKKKKKNQEQKMKKKILALLPNEKEAFLSQTCRYALILLQQEIRFRHGRKEIHRGVLYTPIEETINTSNFVVDENFSCSENQLSTGALSKVVSIVAHNLLKQEIQNYLDILSAKMAVQETNLISFTSGRILDDGSNQPLCDSIRGIFVTPRWKICPYDSTLSSFDLRIGKNFYSGE